MKQDVGMMPSQKLLKQEGTVRRIVACSQSSSQCLLVSTVFGTVSSLHPTSFLMIYTIRISPTPLARYCIITPTQYYAFDHAALHSLAEKRVVVTNEEQRVFWEGYGLRLHIPSNAPPEGYSQFELKMKVALAKEFQLPEEDAVVVSAVYSFSHELGDKQLCHPITLEMQHYAATTAAVKDLCLVRADESSHESVPGVVFDSDGYAKIELYSFSSYYVKFRCRINYWFSTVNVCAKLYYTNMEPDSFRFYLYLIPQLEPALTVCLVIKCYGIILYISIHFSDD